MSSWRIIERFSRSFGVCIKVDFSVYSQCFQGVVRLSLLFWNFLCIILLLSEIKNTAHLIPWISEDKRHENALAAEPGGHPVQDSLP